MHAQSDVSSSRPGNSQNPALIDAAPVLSVRGLSKFYPGIVALDSVDLDIAAGSAHALVGENGAGKSTLIKILAGATRPDGGQIQMSGRHMRFPTPLAARRAGIAVVHQHSHLIPDLTLAENFALREGYPRGFLGGIAWGNLSRAAAQAVHVMLPGMDVRRRASTLSGVEKQMVEISFALAAKPRVLILDEPTAILPYAESDRLFRMVRAFLAGDGSVLFVSHRLDEVFDLCDTVTVLRDGKRVWVKPIGDTSHDDLIRGMVGRGVSFERDETLVPGDVTMLAVNGLTDSAGAFDDVNLDLRAGEIYGIYGLVGAGQAELCAVLLGLRKCRGDVKLAGKSAGDTAGAQPARTAANTELAGKSAGARVRRGLALVPAERLERGMFRQMTVGENMSIASLNRKTLLGMVRGGLEDAENRQSITDLRVKTPGPHKKALQLSGGNQQKVLLARWLQTNPRVLILEEPTQGVDVGAKMEIHRLIREQARTGVAILLVSSEMPELLALSHRVGIMRQGQLVSELNGATATEEEILRLALPPQENPPESAASLGAPSPSAPLLGAPASLPAKSASADANSIKVSDTLPGSASSSAYPGSAGGPPAESASADSQAPKDHQLAATAATALRPHPHPHPRRKPTAGPGAFTRFLAMRELGLGLLLILIIAAGILFVPQFGTVSNLAGILQNQSVLLLMALGVGTVIIAGGIDISIGAIMGLAALAAAKADLNGHPTILIVALPLLVGLGLGALNGVLTVFGRVHSIVITLGMMFILQGVMLEIMDNKWLTNLSDNLRSLARGDLAQVPKRVIFGAAATVVTAILLGKLVSGRRFYALGGDRPSAELLGVNPRLVLPLAFAFSGLLVGLAGLLHASYYGQVQTTVGRGYELKAIAAAVIGGTHIMGGRGSALGILLGALLLGIITNLLVLLHIPAVWDSAVTGAVILLAVCADAFSSRRERSTL